MSLRPAVQQNCRKCHEALSGAMSRCWMCGTRAAGVRWGRLLVRVTLVALAAAAALAFLR